MNMQRFGTKWKRKIKLKLASRFDWKMAIKMQFVCMTTIH